MGYDFAFARLVPPPPDLPFDPPVGGQWKVEALRSAVALEEFMTKNGAFRANGAAGGMRFYRWQPADGGFIDLSVGEKFVSLDMHASWSSVLELFHLLEPIEPGLLIVDRQTATFYDAKGFDAFAADSITGKKA